MQLCPLLLLTPPLRLHHYYTLHLDCPNKGILESVKLDVTRDFTKKDADIIAELFPLRIKDPEQGDCSVRQDCDCSEEDYPLLLISLDHHKLVNIKLKENNPDLLALSIVELRDNWDFLETVQGRDRSVNMISRPSVNIRSYLKSIDAKFSFAENMCPMLRKDRNYSLSSLAVGAML